MEQNIPEVVRNTATNMNGLLLQLANHIEQLEAENKILKEENDRLSRSSSTQDT